MLDEALREPSRLALVVGDAGIGKTRLVTEALRRARGRGSISVDARCLPLAEKLPLLPVSDLLRRLHGLLDGRVLSASLDRLPAYVRIELARLLPQLAADVTDGRDQPAGGDRERLFAAVSAVLLEIARGTPVVALIEDVHWADGATLDLLTYLEASARGSALALVVTCRSDEAPINAPVVAWLSNVRRAMATEVRLPALSRAEVSEQAARQLGRALPAEFVDELYARAGGNPFLTDLLVAAARTDPARDGPALPRELPGGLAELLVARTRQVSDGARAVLAALAIAGRPLTEPVLAASAGMDIRTIRAALRELSGAALLAPFTAADGGCEPRHTLLAEAVVSALLPGERVALHARTAEALDGTGDRALSAEIAEHWAQAGRPRDELRATVAAADAAVHVSAFGDAAMLWERAIRLAEQMPEASASLSIDVARLHVAAIDALESAGRREDAGDLAEIAYRRFGDATDRRTAVLVRLAAARRRRFADESAARPLYEEALRLLEGTPPSADYAEALRAHAVLSSLEGSSEAAVAGLHAALHMAEEVGAAEAQVRTLCNLADTHLIRGAIADGLATMRRAGILADTLGTAEPSIWVANVQSDALLHLGRLEEATRLAVDGLGRARRGGLAGHFLAGSLACAAAEAQLEQGRTELAAQLLDPLTDGPPRPDHWLPHVWRAEVDLRRGAIDSAAQRIGAVRRLPLEGQRLIIRDVIRCAGEVAIWRRDPGAAFKALETVLVRFEASDDEHFLGPLFVLALRAVADIAERAEARADPSATRNAHAARDRLLDLLERMGDRPFTDHPLLARLPADRASWAAEDGRANGTAEPGAWEAAAVRWQELGRPHREAYAWWRCAQTHLRAARSPSPAAIAALQAAAAAAEGMAPLSTAIAALARRTRVTLHPPGGTLPTSAAPPPVPYHLTDRERLVLRLIAQGRTNAQIGAELFMSPKTASVHVTNILRKLHATNRSQAAALAERAGLLDELAPPGG